jgi:hypothetical protein
MQIIDPLLGPTKDATRDRSNRLFGNCDNVIKDF